MAGILDSVQRASFLGIPFACERYSVRGGIRDNVHEFRHSPGGQPEIQGRRLYTIEFDAVFSNEMPLYPDAWPGFFGNLREAFEAGRVADLVIPTMGTISAYCIDWPVDVDFRRMRDGVKAKLTFREDSQEELSAERVVEVKYASLPEQSSRLIEEMEEAELSFSLFDAIFNLIADIEAAAQFSEFYVEIYLDKIDALITACQRIEERTVELARPENWKVVRAIQALGVRAMLIREDALRKLAPIITFTCPALMSIVDVSVSLYGDSSRAVEILQLNRNPPIDDAFSIAQGTSLRAYAPLEAA